MTEYFLDANTFQRGLPVCISIIQGGFDRVIISQRNDLGSLVDRMDCLEQSILDSFSLFGLGASHFLVHKKLITIFDVSLGTSTAKTARAADAKGPAAT